MYWHLAVPRAGFCFLTQPCWIAMSFVFLRPFGRALGLALVGLLSIVVAPSVAATVVDRDEFSTTVDVGGGKLKTTLSSEPLNYQTDSGAWKPVDVELETNADGSVGPQSVDGDVAIPESLAQPVELEHDGRSATLRLLGASGDVDVDGAQASFDGAMPGVDVSYVARPYGVKETLRLASRLSPRSFAYELRASTLWVASMDRGDVVLKDSAGVERYRVSAPLAWDSAEDPAFTNALALSVSKVADGRWRVTLRPDVEWLADPARVYPVSIDPDFSWSNGTTHFNGAQDCYLSGYTQAGYTFCAQTYLQTGWYNRPYRSMFKFDIAAAIPSNATVSSAQFKAFAPPATPHIAMGHSLHTITSDWDSTATWNNRKPGTPWTTAGGGGDLSTNPAYTSPSTTVQAYNAWYSWNAPLATVQGWVNGTLPNYGLMLRADNTGNIGNAYAWASTEASTTSQFPADSTKWPTLDVTWSEPGRVESIAADADSKTAPAKFTLTASRSSGVSSGVEWDLDDDGAFDDATGMSATVVREPGQIGDFPVAARLSGNPGSEATMVLNTTAWRSPGTADSAHHAVDLTAGGSENRIIVNPTTGDLAVSVADVGTDSIDGVPIAISYHGLRSGRGEFGPGTSLTWGRDLRLGQITSELRVFRGPDVADTPLIGASGQPPTTWSWHNGAVVTEANTYGRGGVHVEGNTVVLDDDTAVNFPSPISVTQASQVGAATAATGASDGGIEWGFDYDLESGGTITRSDLVSSDEPDEAASIAVGASGGRITSLSTPDGGLMEVAYDADGRLTSVVRTVPEDDGTLVSETTELTWTGDRLIGMSSPSESYSFAYDALGRVTSVMSTLGAETDARSFAYTPTLTTLSGSSESTSSWTMSSNPASHSTVGIVAQPGTQDGGPTVEPAASNVLAVGERKILVWRGSGPARVRLAVKDDNGVSRVDVGGAHLAVGDACTSAKCPQEVVADFDPDDFIDHGWRNGTGHYVDSQANGLTNVWCDTVTSYDAQSHSSATEVCLISDQYDAPHPAADLVQDAVDSEGVSVAWTPGENVVAPPTPEALAWMGVAGDPASLQLAIAREEIRYRTNGGAFSAWMPADEGTAILPGTSVGDAIDVEIRTTDVLGRTATAHESIAAVETPVPEVVDDPNEFTSTGTRTLRIQVIDPDWREVGHEGRSGVSVAVDQGRETITQLTDGDGVITIPHVADPVLTVRYEGHEIAVPTSADSDPAATRLADYPVPGGFGGLKRDHPEVYRYCVPNGRVVGVGNNKVWIPPSPATVLRRSQICTDIRGAAADGTLFGVAAFTPDEASTDGGFAAYDATAGNALQHAAWAAFTYARMSANGRPESWKRAAQRVIRDLYEYRTLRGLAADENFKQLRGGWANKQNSRMDQWNDDRGRDLAYNRRKMGFGKERIIRLCRTLFRRASQSRQAYFNKLTFSPRPPGGSLVFNFLTIPYGPYAGTPAFFVKDSQDSFCGRARRTRVTAPPDEGPGNN